MKISFSNTKILFILCISLILLFNHLHLLRGVEVNGNDPVVVYKFYSGLVDGNSFDSWVNFYGNNELFILLPAFTYLLYQITPALSLSEYTYIISSLTDVLIIISVVIYSKRNYTDNNILISSVLLLFIVLFPYGMTIQLSRQSLCIGLFISPPFFFFTFFPFFSFFQLFISLKVFRLLLRNFAKFVKLFLNIST